MNDVTLTKEKIGIIMPDLYCLKGKLEFEAKNSATLEIQDQLIAKLKIIRKLLGQ